MKFDTRNKKTLRNNEKKKSPAWLFLTMFTILMLDTVNATELYIRQIFQAAAATCDTIGTAYFCDANGVSSDNKHFIGGYTWSKTDVLGFAQTDCFDWGVPFIDYYTISDGSHKTFYFNELV